MNTKQSVNCESTRRTQRTHRNYFQPAAGINGFLRRSSPRRNGLLGSTALFLAIETARNRPVLQKSEACVMGLRLAACVG
jgi:hypothetical protein